MRITPGSGGPAAASGWRVRRRPRDRHRRRRGHAAIFRPAAAATSRRRSSKWTARSICRRPTTRGPWMRARAASCGTTSGRRRAARTSAAAAWRCGTTTSTSRRRTTTSSRSRRRPGKERWHKVISDFNQQYFSTMAPVVIGNHVLAGTGNDLDAPGFLQSFDPETGELQWKFYTVPHEPGRSRSRDVGQPRRRAAWRRAGRGSPARTIRTRSSISSAPATRRRPTREGRGEGDNLFTCSLIAVNVDTGKMAWYYQTSPHDKHDWDSAQTPVLFDGQINGKPRKLVATAARNGYFFVLDRTTGERLVSGPFGSARELGERPRRQGAAQARSA